MESNKINTISPDNDTNSEIELKKYKMKKIIQKDECTEDIKKKSFRNKILDEIVFPEIKHKITEASSIQKMWNVFAGTFITLKYLAASISMIFVFLSSSSLLSDKQTLFALIGGLLHVCSLVCEQLGKYFSINSDKVLKNKNELLESIGINYKEPDTNFSDALNYDNSNNDTDDEKNEHYDNDIHTHNILKNNDTSKNNNTLKNDSIIPEIISSNAMMLQPKISN